MNNQIELAKKALNYGKIDFFEKNSIKLLAVLLHKYGAIENIINQKINNDFDISNLVNDKIYSVYLKDFKIALQKEAFLQLAHMLYDVRAFFKKKEFIIFGPLGPTDCSQVMRDYNKNLHS